MLKGFPTKRVIAALVIIIVGLFVYDSIFAGATQKYNYPYSDMEIVNNHGYIFVTDIESQRFAGAFRFFSKQRGLQKKIVVEIHSPGGSLFDATRMIGIMQDYERDGWIIETVTHSLAASAAFIIFEAGSPGHRYANSSAILMWHELSVNYIATFKPSDARQFAKVLTLMQYTMNKFVANHCNLTFAQINAKTDGKELWVNGIQAKKYGMVDKIIDF